MRGEGAELLGEDRPTPLVLLNGFADPPEQDAEPHHLLVGGLAEGVVVGETPGVGEGLVVGATCLGHVDQPAQRGEVSLPVVILVGEHPIVEVPGQEVPPVELDYGAKCRRLCHRPGPGGACGSRGVEHPVELLDVQPVRGGGVEAQRVGGDREMRAVAVADDVLDLPQGVTESASGPAFGEIGPEAPGEEVPLLRAVTMHDQISE